MKIYDIPEGVKLYKCGSINQWKALEALGIDYIDSFISKKTKKVVRVYIWTDEITNFLVEWGKNKPKSKDGDVI